MKNIPLLVFIVTLFAFVSTTRATTASSKGKTVHVHEIHQDQSDRSAQSAPKVDQSADAAFPCRSCAEREMINPG